MVAPAHAIDVIENETHIFPLVSGRRARLQMEISSRGIHEQRVAD
jgi:hypothetical protein